jgi:hypothetical protein
VKVTGVDPMLDSPLVAYREPLAALEPALTLGRLTEAATVTVALLDGEERRTFAASRVSPPLCWSWQRVRDESRLV